MSVISFSPLSIQYYSSLLVFTFLYIIVVAVVYARYFVLSLYLKFKVNCESISTPSHLAVESFAAECVNWCVFAA
jgi:hypothetical protein